MNQFSLIFQFKAFMAVMKLSTQSVSPTAAGFEDGSHKSLQPLLRKYNIWNEDYTLL